MQNTKIGIWIGTAAILMLLLVGGCNLLGEEDPDSDSPSVGSVDEVELEDEASTDDFATLTSGNPLPADQTETLYLAVLGLGSIAESLESAAVNWEPSGDSTFDLQPEDLLSGKYEDAPPPRIVLEAILENEMIGVLGVGARADADVEFSLNADDLPTRITGSAAGRLDADLNDAIAGTQVNVQGGSMHGVLDVAVDARIDGWRNVDGEDVPSSVTVAYAVSLKLSSAMSVTADGQSDSSITTPREGNLLISGDLSANQTLSITQEMLDDQELLAEYLEEQLQEPEFEMSIAVYDSDRALQTTHQYNLEYFTQLMEDEIR